MTSAQKLRALVAAPEILVTPGIYDAFSAYRAQEAGFQAVFVSGSALAMIHLARPDIGLLGLTDTAEIVSRIAERVDIPLFVDADQGFGNAAAVARTVQLMERAGAAGIQIEDQQEVKPVDAPLSRPVLETSVMIGKIKAALDARRDHATIISARTDAKTTLGFDHALERAHAYAEAGADMVFVESLTSRADMELLTAQLGGKVPLLHNLLRSKDEVRDAQTAQQIGYSVALFPGTAVGAVGQALDNAFTALKSVPEVANTGQATDRIGAARYLSSFTSNQG